MANFKVEVVANFKVEINAKIEVTAPGNASRRKDRAYMALHYLALARLSELTVSALKSPLDLHTLCYFNCWKHLRNIPHRTSQECPGPKTVDEVWGAIKRKGHGSVTLLSLGRYH